MFGAQRWRFINNRQKLLSQRVCSDWYFKATSLKSAFQLWKPSSRRGTVPTASLLQPVFLGKCVRLTHALSTTAWFFLSAGYSPDIT